MCSESTGVGRSVLLREGVRGELDHGGERRWSKNIPLIFFLILSAATIGSKTGWAQIVDGIQVGPVTPDGGSGFQISEVGIPDLNFDGSPAPCVFLETVALTDQFSNLGVTFSGPGGDDGGAVLDQCGNFSVTEFSSPNFLAFNIGAVYPNGGVPRGPETLRFAQPVASVRINGGAVRAGTIMMECFDGAGMVLGSDSITATSSLQPLSVVAAGIESCVLSFTGSVAVFDDLAISLIFSDGFESGDVSAWSAVVGGG